MKTIFHILLSSLVLLSIASCSPGQKEDWIEADGTQVILPDGGLIIVEFSYNGWDYLVNDLETPVSVTLQSLYLKDKCFELAPGETSEKLMRGYSQPGNSLSESKSTSIMIDGELVCQCFQRWDTNDCESYFYNNYQSEVVYEMIELHGYNVRRTLEQRTYHIDNLLLEKHAQCQDAQ